MPIVELNLNTMTSLQQSGVGGKLEVSGFWQKTLWPELVSLLNSKWMMDAFKSNDNPSSDLKVNDKDWIAIVGMSCRFPNANTVDEYWEVLTSARSTAGAPPSNRLGKCSLPENMRGNFLKCPIDEFDASFFKIPPSVAAFTDPQARLLLETSWEAFEDAGINPDKLRATPVGVFYGSWIQEYKDLLNSQEKCEKDFRNKYAGSGFGSTAAKLSFFYGFTGPNIATESACSSSMMAVKLACDSLQNGDCPLALAAGANVILQMDQSSKVIWATDGLCRPFDSHANGYGRGEGVGVLVLKRYSDAIRDGDRIHGIILGFGSSQEGLSPSFATPTVENEIRSMKAALLAAKLSPAAVDYVEAHATGTGVGDPIEAKAIVKAYSNSVGAQKRKAPLLIGSGKTNIGHAESCSGIAAIIKVLLAMKHETLPPHINLETLSPKVDFSSIPGKIPLECEEWKRSSSRRRIAGVSNFGITGTAVHVIVQEPPQQHPEFLLPILKKSQEMSLHILALSAKTRESLEQLTLAYMALLKNGKDTLADITYSANACRAHHYPCRSAIIGSTKKEMVFQLQSKNYVGNKEAERKLKICFISHDLINEMNFEQLILLYSTFPAFQISMDVCDALCNEIAGFSPVIYLLNNQKATSSSDTLKKEQLQLLTLSVTYSLFKLWDIWGVKASAVVGLNFGELAGAVIAGELKLEESFQLLMGVDDDKVLKQGEIGRSIPKKEIGYISATNGEQHLNMGHWKEMCNQKGSSSNHLHSALTKASLDFGCDVFIQVDFQGKLGLVAAENEAVLQLPIERETCTTGEGNELLFRLLSTLATLYRNGYPVDWEGFFTHQHCRKVSVPHYPFQRKSIWLERKEPTPTPNPDVAKITCQLWGKDLHPLLGSYISPTSSLESEIIPKIVFENSIVAAQHQGSYSYDHLIGSEVIFPMAAYLELLLSALSFQQGLPYIVNNFLVLHPLHLNSSAAKKIRTVMTKTDGEDWNVFVEAEAVENQSQAVPWKRYASGETRNEKQQLSIGHYNLEEIKGRCIMKESNHSEFYKRVVELGYNYGKEFKPLQIVYEGESSGEVLAQVLIPESAIHHICHPILLEAMLQCYLYYMLPDLTTLHVPVNIEKFVCYRRLTPQECLENTNTCYVYYSAKDSKISLLDSEGKVIATMTQPELKATTISSILTAAGCVKEHAEDNALDIWEVSWKPAFKYQTEGSLVLTPTLTQFSSSFVNLLRRFEKRNHFTRTQESQFKLAARLSELYVYKAFHDLGWEPILGEMFVVAHLAEAFKISPNFLNAFRHFLTYFERNGVLEITGQRETTICRVKALPEAWELVENSIADHSNALVEYGPIQSLNACASALASVMQGKSKGQQILFTPGKTGLTPADIIYKGLTFYKNSANAAPRVFCEIVKQLWSQQQSEGTPVKKIRILEVGAGTGIFTSDVIPLLEEEEIVYTYFYTDISSRFFKAAEKRFPKLVYKIFDIEKDPLGQGFPPAYFYVVVGLDVVHATKDLRKSIQNLQMLMKQRASIILAETNGPLNEIDVTFGILDGYWRFEDYETRPTHCTITSHKWLKLLRESGFRGPSAEIFLAESHLCIVVATLSLPHGPDKDCHQIMERNPVDNPKTWLLLHDLEEAEEWVVDVLASRMCDLGRHLVSKLLPTKNNSEGECLAAPKPEDYLNEKESRNLEGILCFFQGADSLASTCHKILC